MIWWKKNFFLFWQRKFFFLIFKNKFTWQGEGSDLWPSLDIKKKTTFRTIKRQVRRSWHVHWTRGKTLVVDLFVAPPGYIYLSFSSNKTAPPQKKSLSQLKMLPFQPVRLKRSHYLHENSRVPLLRTVIMGCSGSKQKVWHPKTETMSWKIHSFNARRDEESWKVKLLSPPPPRARHKSPYKDVQSVVKLLPQRKSGKRGRPTGWNSLEYVVRKSSRFIHLPCFLGERRLISEKQVCFRRQCVCLANTHTDGPKS